MRTPIRPPPADSIEPDSDKSDAAVVPLSVNFPRTCLPAWRRVYLELERRLLARDAAGEISLPFYGGRVQSTAVFNELVLLADQFLNPDQAVPIPLDAPFFEALAEDFEFEAMPVDAHLRALSGHLGELQRAHAAALRRIELLENAVAALEATPK